MKLKAKTIFILVFVMVCQLASSQDVGFRQDSTKFFNSKFWIDVNLGAAACGNSSYENSNTDLLGFKLDFNVISKNYRYLKYRFGIQQEFGLFSSVQQLTTEVDVMTGKLYQKKSFMFAFTAGAGIIAGNIKGKRLPDDPYQPGLVMTQKYEQIDFVTVGIPFDIKSNYSFPSWAVGVGVAGNLNLKLNYVGLYLNIQFASPVKPKGD